MSPTLFRDTPTSSRVGKRPQQQGISWGWETGVPCILETTGDVSRYPVLGVQETQGTCHLTLGINYHETLDSFKILETENFVLF